MFDHAHHAHNRDRLFRIEPEMLANRVSVRPETLRELLVNDDDLLRVRPSCSVKKRPANKGISMARK